jgi:histidinol-phosphatase (PHP family)
MWFNYHTHSVYCDGKSSLEEIVERAHQLRLHSVGFSSHAPLPFVRSWCMKADQLKMYLKNSKDVKCDELEIYSGLEVDYIPTKIGPKDFQSLLDYTIGSVHFVETFSDGQGFEIDLSHQSFLEGLEKIFKNDIKELICRYYELTRKMIEESTPTIVGHLDKIKIQNVGNKFFKESDSWYQHEIKETLDCLKKSGAILEVNTRGVYQKKCETVYPSPWILLLALQKKIPITISSDAHHPKDLITYFEPTARLLLQLGFREISYLKNGKWTSAKFDENGIEF